MINRTFVIDSNNLNSVESKMYGYAITCDGNLVVDEVPSSYDGTGLYSLILRDKNKITITQDFCGSFGIYLYHEGDYFAVSNSFFRLAEYLKGKLTVNEHALDTIFYALDCPIIHRETLVNEIEKLDSSESLIIDIKNKSYYFDKKNYIYYKRKFDSKESFELLDKWYFKWVNVFRNIVVKDYPITSDLSGGLDSRLIFSMLRNGNIDIDSRIKLLCHENVNLDKDKEDYKIAKMITDYYKIELNSDKAIKQKVVGKIDPKDAYEGCKYNSFTKSNMNKYCKNDYATPLISIKGTGSTTKGICWHNFEWFLNLYIDNYYCYDKPKTFIGKNKLNKKRHKQRLYFEKIIEELLDGYESDEKKTNSLIFKKMMIDNVDAPKAHDWMLGNNIVISPFFDPLIAEFDFDPYLDDELFLNTLMLDRYYKELLEFPVQHRKFSDLSIKRAQELNKKYPVKMPKYKKIKGKQITIQKKNLSNEVLGDYLEDIWSKDDFKKVVDKYLGKNVYDEVISTTDKYGINLKPYPVNILLAIYELDKLVQK